ncbi:MAG: hypothetical protein MUE60_15200, partial [Candidatus Eisenbacteria bacterium]|nr:hypothetical protein [Candidatus Eisenbacteria bacterium]
WVYGAEGAAFFEPDVTSPFAHRLVVLPQGTMAWVSPHAPGSAGFGWTYLVVAATLAGQEVCRSDRVGEISYLSELPSRPPLPPRRACSGTARDDGSLPDFPRAFCRGEEAIGIRSGAWAPRTGG